MRVVMRNYFMWLYQLVLLHYYITSITPLPHYQYYTVKNRVLPQHPPFCTMSVGCYSNTPRVLMAPYRVLNLHIKHPGDVTVTPQGVAAKFRVQNAAVKNSNIATQLLSLLLVHFKSGSNYALLKVY